jgi:hypothetical protein
MNHNPYQHAVLPEMRIPMTHLTAPTAPGFLGQSPPLDSTMINSISTTTAGLGGSLLWGWNHAMPNTSSDFNSAVFGSNNDGGEQRRTMPWGNNRWIDLVTLLLTYQYSPFSFIVDAHVLF